MKMKYSISLTVVACMLLSGFLKAQIVMPDLSPFASVTQKVGFNDVTIEYSRPSVKGRVIFGELVPYGKLWRLGANQATKIYTKEEINIEDHLKLPAGIYAIYAVPEKDQWNIVISKNAWNWGLFGYLEEYDVLRFPVKTQTMKEPVETFTIQFANVCSSCAEIQFMWEFTKVSFRISTNTDEKVMNDIKAFTANPEAKLGGEYYLAAKYYLDSGRDLKQALLWIDKALGYVPGSYYMTHTKAEIQAKMGNYKDAIETANLSKEQAKAKNDEDYVRINDLEIMKWKEAKKNKAGSN